jgi:hypothetical protein
MIVRFFKIEEFLDKDEDAISHLFPRQSEKLTLKNLMDQLVALQEISTALQRDDCDLADARAYFDEVLQWFPQMGERHLDEDARIVHDPVFQTAVTKAIFGEPLDEQETAKLQKFKRVETAVAPSETSSSSSLAEQARQKKRRKIEQNQPSSGFVNMKIVLPTSNCCERLFSIVGCESLSHLEMLIFLKINREFWSVEDVQAILDRKN